ncbi:Manganese transporter p.t1.c1 [Penicillium argentinense]|uniref:Manganese transporter p.t1.c1 n=1 Tax=Penicillium argentinense TaxID=1131581 RepID=A0A9W9G072_9EURO|nr:Manganese transporter p.t1.c1 [Penicillium argentinense]KAJ5109563.1 Manganese transporter p.t1.c1 [Penicillium argentinense]
MPYFSILFAIVLQFMCIERGNMAETCRVHLLRWMFAFFIFSQRPNIPVIAGYAITLVDVFFPLLFWRPKGSM